MAGREFIVVDDADIVALGQIQRPVPRGRDGILVLDVIFDRQTELRPDPGHRTAGSSRGVVVHHDYRELKKAAGLLVPEGPQQTFEHSVAAKGADAYGDVIDHGDEYDIIDNTGNVKDKAGGPARDRTCP